MTDYPFPWRATCVYCTKAMSTTSGQDRSWNIVGQGTECRKAPEQANGDPGHHAPRVVLSAAGNVPADVVASVQVD